MTSLDFDVFDSKQTQNMSHLMREFRPTKAADKCRRVRDALRHERRK